MNIPTSAESLSNQNVFRRLLRTVAERLAPQDCFVCGGAAGGQAVCPECLAELPPQPALACPICALPTPDGLVCGHCLSAPPAFDATRAVFSYAFPVDRMVQALKYHRRLALARFFADCLQRVPPPPGADLILPMPIHVQRLRERGFNQSVELARPLARAWGLPLARTLVRRTRDTPAQAGLTRAARMANLRGVFVCEGSLAGRHVWVVDDVMTTGTSLNELARTLKRHGAARVENLVLARTP